MLRPGKRGKGRTTAGARAARLLLAWSFGLPPLLAGCSGLGSLTGTAPAAQATDPLIGDQVPVGSVPPPAPAAPAAQPGPAKGPVAGTTTGSTGSTAALAMGAAPLTGARPSPGIHDGVGGSGKDGWKGSGQPASNGGTVPQLRRPEPVVEAGPGRVEPVPPVATNGGVLTAGNRTVGGGDYGQLFARLVAHGMIWHRQESVGDGVKFTCLLANRQNPNIQHQHEATAADPVAALQAVLDRIEHGR
jgi:hypothetical protein